MHFSGKEKRDGVEKKWGCEIFVKKERAGNVHGIKTFPSRPSTVQGRRSRGGLGGLYTLSYKPKQIKN